MKLPVSQIGGETKIRRAAETYDRETYLYDPDDLALWTVMIPLSCQSRANPYKTVARRYRLTDS